MYQIKNRVTGQVVGGLDLSGKLVCPREEDRKVIEPFFQSEILVREEEGAGGEDELEPVMEEEFCFFGFQTLRPGEPGHLKAALQRLSLLTDYQAALMNIQDQPNL